MRITQIAQIFILGGNRTPDPWLSSQGLEPLDQQASQFWAYVIYYQGVATLMKLK